jgi:hypothetical protein
MTSRQPGGSAATEALDGALNTTRACMLHPGMCVQMLAVLGSVMELVGVCSDEIGHIVCRILRVGSVVAIRISLSARDGNPWRATV